MGKAMYIERVHSFYSGENKKRVTILSLDHSIKTENVIEIVESVMTIYGYDNPLMFWFQCNAGDGDEGNGPYEFGTDISAELKRECERALAALAAGDLESLEENGLGPLYSSGLEEKYHRIFLKEYKECLEEGIVLANRCMETEHGTLRFSQSW